MSRILFAATVLLLAVLVGIGVHWVLDHYHDRPTTEVYRGDPRLKFRSGAFLAREAAQQYQSLPPNERRALRQDLLASLITLDDWATTVAAGNRLICVGERHHPAIRAFLAQRLFPRLDYTALMLETGEDGLARIQQSMFLDGDATLLGAPIGSLIRTSGRSGTPPRLVAIDETRDEVRARAERRAKHPPPSLREEILTRKALASWEAQGQHLVLMGALHCRDTPGWLFHELASASGAATRKEMLALVVMARSQEAGARLLFYLLDEMDIEPAVLVIPDVSRFPRQIQSWLPPVADALAGYQSAILFDEQRL